MNKMLFVACRGGGETTGQWAPVGRLERIGDKYRFQYTKGATTLPGFQPFFSMRDLNAVYESHDLFPQFSNRLLSEARPEYEAFLVWGGFDPANPPDPIALLGVTQGRRATDPLELFPCPSPDEQGRYISKFFLHGVQWMPEPALRRIDALVPGESLGVMLDMNNPYHADAVAVRTCDTANRYLIGYVPRYLARDVGELSAARNSHDVAVTVERVNPGAPLQQRILCRMTATWPEGFAPCSLEEYQPIAEEAAYVTH